MKFRTDENRTTGGKAVESVKGDSRESHGADSLWKGEKLGDRHGLPGRASVSWRCVLVDLSGGCSSVRFPVCF